MPAVRKKGSVITIFGPKDPVLTYLGLTQLPAFPVQIFIKQ